MILLFVILQFLSLSIPSQNGIVDSSMKTLLWFTLLATLIDWRIEKLRILLSVDKKKFKTIYGNSMLANDLWIFLNCASNMCIYNIMDIFMCLELIATIILRKKKSRNRSRFGKDLDIFIFGKHDGIWIFFSFGMCIKIRKR